MELRDRLVEDQGQEVPITFPHGQCVELVDPLPAQRTLLVGVGDVAVPPVDDEDEPEVVLAVSAETRPRDRATQPHGIDLQTGLLPQLAPHAGSGVLTGFDLATQSVVLAELVVVVAGDAVHHEHMFTVGVPDESQGREHRRHHATALTARPSTA